MIFSRLENIELEKRNNQKVVSSLFDSSNRRKMGFYFSSVPNMLMEFFPHAEGYVNVTSGTTGNRIFNYVFNYTDHLGNIRLSFTKDPVSNELKILEENHYYPFGLKHGAYADSKQKYKLADDLEDVARPGYVTKTDYNYKYNGKELQDELNLNFYDYGARNYDPALGRWMNIDPLAENSRRWTPYNYVYNNPLAFTDPDGMKAVSSLQEMWDNTTSSSTWVNNGDGGFEQVNDNPIFDSETGEYLGSDDKGLDGEIIVMNKNDYNLLTKNKEGKVSHKAALKKGTLISQLGTNGKNIGLFKNIVKETVNIFFNSTYFNPQGGDISKLTFGVYSPDLGKGLQGSDALTPTSWGGWSYNTVTFNYDFRGKFTIYNIYGTFEHEYMGHGGKWGIKYTDSADEHRQIYLRESQSLIFPLTTPEYQEQVMKWISQTQ